jgi:hypothetical protein
MQKISGIYTRSRMGIDNKVWLTLLITTLLSVALFGFKIATTEPCYEIKLSLKGVVEHPFANNYFVGEYHLQSIDEEIPKSNLGFWRWHTYNRWRKSSAQLYAGRQFFGYRNGKWQVSAIY